MIYQLCGPVTSLPRKRAVEAFGRAGDMLHANGNAVWSPVDAVPSHYSHEDAMQVCLQWLTSPAMKKRGVLVTLPGWEASEGACLEVAVARAVGVPVMALSEAVGCEADDLGTAPMGGQ